MSPSNSSPFNENDYSGRNKNHQNETRIQQDLLRGSTSSLVEYSTCSMSRENIWGELKKFKQMNKSYQMSQQVLR